MKKIFNITTLLFIFSINCNCQVTTTMPFETYDYPNGAYLKDLENKLPFYVGTWEGILNNKKYTFEFVKFTQHLSQSSTEYYHYEDELMGKFRVIDLATGTTLYDNLAATDYDDYNIFLTTLKAGGSFTYLDSEHCFNSARFELFKVVGNPNQLRYNQFRSTTYHYSDCPYQSKADIPMFLPTGDLILTRQ